MIQTFTHPRSCAFSKDLTLTINGQPVEVLYTEAADFANFIYDAAKGSVEVCVTRRHDTIDGFKIRPLAKGIDGQAEVKELRFTLEAAEKLSIEIDGMRPLFLWANPPETDKPSPQDPDVVYFKAGQIYEIECLSMKSGQTLYIEGGAVLKTRMITSNAENVTLRGHGIFDGAYYRRGLGESVPSIVFDHCKNVVVRDITMIHPSGWMLLPGACEDVQIFNLKQIGEVVNSDGIDIVGSKRVHIHDCFLRNNDDCVVVKAFSGSKNNLAPSDFAECPEDILVENCILLNAPAGNAMEIGHELSVDYVANVTFRNIDVLSVHGHGAVFSLHNNDRAEIRDVLFEDIRVEHCWDKFIDFRISKSRYSTDATRGSIKRVTLRNINWHQTPSNAGYTVSIIGGWSPEHTIENVRIENLCLNGEPIQHIDDLEITTRYIKDIAVHIDI
jgi:hypothetical protein